MNRVEMYVRRLFMGMALGEVILVLGILDIVRGQLMAEATGVASLKWMCPLAKTMTWATQPLWRFSEEVFGQDPIALFALTGAYWAVIGVVLFFTVALLWRFCCAVRS